MNDHGEKEADHMEPYDHSDFEKGVSIGDLIKNINDKYLYIYPGTPKHKAFCDFYTNVKVGPYKPKRRMYSVYISFTHSFN